MPFSAGDDIVTVLGAFASSEPHRIALVAGDRVLTRADLVTRIARAAGGFAREGVGKGRRVAILGRNTVEYVIAFLGALGAGASVVPLPTMATTDALRAMLRDSSVSALLATREYGEPALVAARGVESLGDAAVFGLDFEHESFRDFRQWLEGEGDPPSTVLIEGADEFDVMYSSGTTGVPKGIVHSHAVRKASYRGSRARYFDQASVNVVATPFYSNTTCVTWLLTLAAGGANVLMTKFDAGDFLDIVERHRATHAMLVPVQHERILRAESLAHRDTSSLTHLFSTSAPMQASTKRAILDRFTAELVEIYGLTEGGVVTALVGRSDSHKLATVGRPTPGCDARIIDDDGRELPVGRAGEVVGRSTSIMCGYLNRPEATRELVWRDAEGRLFLRSGDIGRLDEEGYLHLLDRKKDVIISGGLNVYATDLEMELLQHPGVHEAAVIGVPSDRWGETPFGFVVVEPDASVTEEGLRDWCNARVGKAQRLGGLTIVGELPKNAIGKVLKRELRERYDLGRSPARA
jgi:long-chain acyl-CoA synthetase